MYPHSRQTYLDTAAQESIPVGTPIFDWFSPDTRLMFLLLHFGQVFEFFTASVKFSRGYIFLRANDVVTYRDGVAAESRLAEPTGWRHVGF